MGIMLFSLVIFSIADHAVFIGNFQGVAHAVVQSSGSYCYHLGIYKGIAHANVIVYIIDKHPLISFYYYFFHL
jgi:hypothetical protein